MSSSSWGRVVTWPGTWTVPAVSWNSCTVPGLPVESFECFSEFTLVCFFFQEENLPNLVGPVQRQAHP